MATATQARPLEKRETSNLIGSDKVEGTPVYRTNGGRVGQIERVMIYKFSGLRSADGTSYGATPIMTVRASTRNGDITEGPMRMNVAGVTAIGTREAYSQICGAVRAFARAALLCGSVKRRAQNHLGQLLR